MNRECTACGKTKPDEDFSVRFGVIPRGVCKPCKSEYNKSWYTRNKTSHVKNVVRNNTRYREEIDRYLWGLKSQPCKDCGNSYIPFAMDFDHLDPNLKVDDLSKMRRSRTRLDTIIAEVAKCDVVCAVCHRIRTWNRLNKPP